MYPDIHLLHTKIEGWTLAQSYCASRMSMSGVCGIEIVAWHVSRLLRFGECFAFVLFRLGFNVTDGLKGCWIRSTRL